MSAHTVACTIVSRLIQHTGGRDQASVRKHTSERRSYRYGRLCVNPQQFILAIFQRQAPFSTSSVVHKETQLVGPCFRGLVLSRAVTDRFRHLQQSLLSRLSVYPMLQASLDCRVSHHKLIFEISPSLQRPVWEREVLPADSLLTTASDSVEHRTR